MTDQGRKGKEAGGQLLFDWATPPASAQLQGGKRELCQNEHRWPPNHPWHYLPKGDDAAPMPFEKIPASREAGRLLAEDLPKARARRIIQARQLQEAERARLEELRERYQDVVTRGALALSRYDREIAYGGNDELARAGTLALLFNQISVTRGRLKFLEVERQGNRGR
jgi:hypothetical protein